MSLSVDRLTDVSPLKIWNVSRGENFEKMFSYCESLKNGNILKDWKFKKNYYFKSMFETYD